MRVLGTRQTVIAKSYSNVQEVWVCRKKAIRLIFRLKSNDNAITFIIQTNILLAILQYIDALTQLMYGVKNYATPPNIKQLFIHSNKIHL